MAILETIQSKALEFWAIVLVWLQSPPFYVQLAAILGAWLAARYLGGQLHKRVPLLSTQPAEGRFFQLRSMIYRGRGLVPALLLVLLLAIIVPILDAATNSSWLVRLAQSLALILALKKAVELFISAPGMQKLINVILLPCALLLVFGVLDEFSEFLDGLAVQLGNIRLSALFLIKAAIFGGVLFWAGRLSNFAGQAAIQSQESLDLGSRSLFSKLYSILLFVVVGIVFFQLMGIDLTVLAVLGGAVGVGLGFGLQQIAANFISGMIILLERSLSIGDYIEMEDGKAGVLKEINMRSTTLETFDGKEVMLPNEKFITTTFVNWTRDDPRQRYEVEFSVAYDTDIEPLPDIIAEAVAAHPQVLDEPEKVDVELRGFGESGIDFAVEFWADGIDDGKNKFSSDVLFIIWRTLQKQGWEIPYPQREIRILGDDTKPKKAKVKSASKPS
ncbi:MAG: mechanosensitive ion channel domain-containing protein [Rhizobiaceae bacterium]